MKLRKILMGLAAVVGFTTAAMAAETRVVSYSVAQCWGGNSRGKLSGESYETLLGTIPLDAWSQPVEGASDTTTETKSTDTCHWSLLTISKYWDGSSAQTFDSSVTGFTIKSYISGGTNLYGPADYTDFRTCVNQALNRNGADNKITVSGIPFEKYDVIIYFAGRSESGKRTDLTLRPVKVNGGSYYMPNSSTPGDNKVASSKTDTWGDCTSSTFVYGTNVMRINGLMTGTLTLEQYCQNYGIAAIQIVERELVKHEATVSTDTDWSKITWTPAIEDPATAILSLTVTDGAKIKLDTTPTFASLNITGTMTIDANGVTGNDIAKNAVAGAPYSYWFFNATGTVTGSVALDPSVVLPDEYVGTAQNVAGYGTRLVVTAPAKAKFGSIGLNFMGNSSQKTSSDSAKVGTLTTNVGVHPAIGTSWNDLEGKNQTDTSVTKYVDSIGTTVTTGNMFVTVAGVNNTYGTTAAAHSLFYGYLDDGGGPNVTVSNIPFSKYRVVVYSTTDNGSYGMNAAQIGLTSSSTQYCYGPNYRGDAGATLYGSSANTWGNSGSRTDCIEGVNCVISDVLEGDSAYVKMTRAGNDRGCICAIQIVEVGEIIDTYEATISDSANFSDITTWDRPLVESPFNEAILNVDDSSTDEVELTFDNTNLTLAKLEIISERDITFTADEMLANVGQFDTAGCTGKVTYNMPVKTLQMTTNEQTKYTCGAGTEEAAAKIAFVENGQLTLTGDSPYYLGDTFQENTNAYAMTFTDVTVYCKSWAGLAVGTGTVTIDGTSQVEAENFILSQGTVGQVSDITIKDSSVVTITGTNVVDSNQSSIMFGHWDGPSTFTLQDDAVFTAEKAQVLVGKTGNTQTINLNGGKFTAKGIKASASATGTNTLNLAGGTLFLGEDGITSYSPNTKIDVNVKADTTIKSLAAMKISQPVTIEDGKTLTLDATDGDIIIMGETGLTKDDVTVAGGTVYYGFTVGINHLGRFKIPEDYTTDQIKLFDKGGNEVSFTTEGEYLVFTWEYTGTACWWDYEFEGNGNNTGTEGTGLNWDGGRPFADDEYVQDETTGEYSLHIPSRPWRNVSSWPTTATFVMYGTMLKDANKYYVVFGSTTGGTKNTVFLATDDIDNGKVVLCRANGLGNNATVTKLCTMTVPNATSAKHLYAFVLKTVDSQSVIDIYLDGELLQEYPFGEVVSLGTGFQIASPHGGEVKGYARPANDDPALLDWLRVYDVELSQAALEKYAVEYPYVSPNGSYQRTVEDGALWDEEDAWTKEGTEPAVTTNAPAAGATAKLTASGETRLSVNLEEDGVYEAIIINGDDLKIEGEGKEGKVVSSGRVTANANVTFGYDAFSMAGAPITVKADKTVTFDLSMVDMNQYFSTQTYDLTGYVTLEDGAKLEFIAPEELYGREISAEINETTKHYVVTVTTPEYPFTYENDTWTWNGQDVDEESVLNNTALAIVVKGDLEWPIDRASITVSNGTLKVTEVKKRAAGVTVEKGATLDLNGNNAKEMALTLNGGVVTYGEETAPSEADQIKVLTLTADSELNTTVKGQIYAQSYNTATTIALDTHTLTKTGTNVLQVVNTDITGTGTVCVAEGEFYGSEDMRAATTTFQVAEGAKLHNREGKTMTLAKIVGEGGTLNNEGKISDFELSGEITIANAGTFGTITNAADAVANIGKKRNLVFAGAGKVNVTLTQEEYEGDMPITLFTTNEVNTVKVGTVMYNDEDITEKCTISGNQITAIQKGGDVPSWIDPQDTTNKELYDTWAAKYQVTDPSAAKQDAFLLNCDNTDEAIEEAKKEFVLTITFDEDGNPVVEYPENYNGTVTLQGKAALTDEEWHEKTEGDKFFQATLQLIPANLSASPFIDK